MVSLTTVYVISVILTSIAGIGSAFASNTLVGAGTQPISLPPPETLPELVPPSNIEQIQPEAPLATE